MKNDKAALKALKQTEPRPIKNPIARVLVLGLSTGFGTGYLPVAPGTWGSLIGLPLGIWLLNFELWAGLLILAAITVPAIWASNRAGLHFGNRDSGKITVDEIVGQALTLLGCHSYLARQGLSGMDIPWELVALSFGLFRLFDIAKPFPARVFDRQPNGFGVMADDVVAGLYGAVLLRFITKMWLSSHSL